MLLATEIVQQITTNSITNLDLSNNGIGDDGTKDIAEALKINQSITTLNLGSNKIGAAGMKDIAEALKINQSITNLVLSSNHIGAAGAKDVAEALKINQSITTLDIQGNKIGDAGAKDIAEALKINPSITTLYLGGNNIGAAGAKDIAKALKINQSITTLELNFNEIGDAGTQALAEALKINQSITTIYLCCNNVEHAGAKDIAEALKINQSITTLYIEINNIGDAGAKDIAEALKINRSITSLYLSSNKIGAAGAKDIAEALRINQSITTLDIQTNEIGNAGAKDIAEALKINQSIINLELNFNHIGDAGTQALAETLKRNQSITTFHFSYNQIGDDGARDIAAALKINQSITTLDLSYNQIGDAGAKDIAEALKINQSITNLHIRINNIGDAGAKDIAEALKVNQFITTLNLSRNEMQDAGAQYIAEALKINQSITTLDLSYNQIGDAGLQTLAEALKINRSITTLDLKNNQIGDAGLQTLNKDLEFNQYIALLVKRLRAVEEELKTIDRAKQAKVKVKDAMKEVERLEQQTKLREEEEAKEVKEAAKLKAREKAKVKEYIPDIPVVKVFEVASENNQFDNDDQSTICQVSSLMREGNDRLQERGKKGILLLGNTGVGKSTLAHLLSGRKLQAIMDDETNEMVIDAMQRLEDIVIGHKLASETKIPNKCFTKDIIIWDCPGFNDTDPVQEIANNFYIKRLFETTDQLKFVLVITESDLRTKRGNDFLEILSNFMKSFKDVGSIEGSISLVVTHVAKSKNIWHIKRSIDKILADNQRAKEEHKRLVNKLKDSIHLFHRPNEEGELLVPDLLAAIDSSSKYADAKGDMISITISKEAKECSSHLLNVASSNFNLILQMIVKAITDATKCLNVNPLNAFSENYNIVKGWIPSSIHYNNFLQKHDKDKYFLELDLLSKLQKVLNCDQIVSIPDAIIILQQAVEIFAEYVEFGNVQLQHKIQGYGYCLQQQYEYVKFFASVCGVELPDHANITRLITFCHAKVTENLMFQVSSLTIDEEKRDQVYYRKAIKYLDAYPDSPVCKNLKAVTYSCLANTVDQNGEKGALAYYVKAIQANSHLRNIYEKLGHLFSKNNEYAKAIDCYKVVNNEFVIEECFKAWLKQDKNNPDIMLKQAEYFESIGLFEQAKRYYHHAFSVSKDDNFKAAVYKKIGNIMVNAVAQGQDYITRSDEYDFCNYDMVDETFINNLLGDTVLKGLYY